jgi:tetratricopeptide (TPR) repeat protein
MPRISVSGPVRGTKLDFAFKIGPHHAYLRLSWFRGSPEKVHTLSKIRKFFLLLCVTALLPISQGSAADPERDGNTAVTELSLPSQSIQARDILTLLYDGKPSIAVAMANRYIEANPNDPLPYLMKARSLRELLPDQDDNKELIRENSSHILGVLDEAITICSSGLKIDKKNLRLKFYRGWAWMYKAQIHSLGGSYWSAGRSAAKGKKDLEKYISKNPDDPDAKGIMGTFLYFADTLPSIFKIIKTLFLIPGGDREKGLQYLHFACNHEGLLQTDHQIMLGIVYTIFEGRFEEGVSIFTTLFDQHPDFLRLVEPLAIVKSFCPGRIQHLHEIEQSAIARSWQGEDAVMHNETIQRLRYHSSYSNMFFESPSLAIKEFTSIIEEAPDRPDWLVPFSLVNLGRLYANSGQLEKAKAAFNTVLDNKEMKRFHNIASQMMKSKNSSNESLLAADAGFIHDIYFIDSKSAESALQNYHSKKGSTVLYEFYRGETMLLSGDFEAASIHFKNALSREVPNYSQAYQMLASVRLAEIMGMQGEYEEAKKYLDKGMDYYHKEYLIDLLIKGRKHFYDRLDKGELDIDPSVLIAIPPTGNSSPAIHD